MKRLLFVVVVTLLAVPFGAWYSSALSQALTPEVEAYVPLNVVRANTGAG